ncbi:hypothetical protein DFH09DRAFT_1277272 [Mycena vulgaris]|nr:hypothetical protein DFH09DRAFT_1277272 [Mycena vulgaris]
MWGARGCGAQMRRTCRNGRRSEAPAAARAAERADRMHERRRRHQCKRLLRGLGREIRPRRSGHLGAGLRHARRLRRGGAARERGGREVRGGRCCVRRGGSRRLRDAQCRAHCERPIPLDVETSHPSRRARTSGDVGGRGSGVGMPGCSAGAVGVAERAEEIWELGDEVPLGRSGCCGEAGGRKRSGETEGKGMMRGRKNKWNGGGGEVRHSMGEGDGRTGEMEDAAGSGDEDQGGEEEMKRTVKDEGRRSERQKERRQGSIGRRWGG